MMEFIGYGLALFIGTWLIFVPIMWAKQNKDKIPTWLHYPLYAVAAIGFLGDVLFNIVFDFFLPISIFPQHFPVAHFAYHKQLTQMHLLK